MWGRRSRITTVRTLRKEAAKTSLVSSAVPAIDGSRAFESLVSEWREAGAGRDDCPVRDVLDQIGDKWTTSSS